MNCKHLTVRSRKGTKFFFCRLKKQQLVLSLSQCRKCSKIEFKTYKTIKNKTSKLSKLEKHRFSILTDDLKHCYICTGNGKKDVLKEDLHEVYGGSNRQRSIKNGLVVPLCRKCHKDYEVLKFLKRYCQITYEETHSREDFIKLIGKSYL